MSATRSPNVPSPLLPESEVKEILIEGVGEAGALGGSFVGPGNLSGAVASGGRSGGKLGARMFTRVTGQGAVLPIPYSDAAYCALMNALSRVIPIPAPQPCGAPHPERFLIGVLGTGWLSMNPGLVQTIWYADRVHITAHALEGIVNQKSAARALDVVREVLAPGAAVN
ncbi:hypothetical protein VR010_09790 [Actinomycetaceae bacterium L2_0104]